MRARPRLRTVARPGLAAVALAALALLIQALVPAAAIAHDNANGGVAMVICTGEGAKTLVVGGQPAGPSAKHFMGLHCTACAFASFAAVDGGDQGLTAQPVRYASAPIAFPPERAHVAKGARAPPRPPGQGPPASLTV